MKRIVWIVVCQLYVVMGMGQDIYKITYHYFRDGAMIKQDPVVVYASKGKTIISKQSVVDGNARYPYEESYITFDDRKMMKQSALSADQKIATLDDQAFLRYSYAITDERKNILNREVRKATTSVNSNAIELWYTNDLGINAAPNDMGLDLGLVMEYRRNGNSGLVATSVERLKSWPTMLKFPKADALLDGLTYKDVLWKSRFIQIPIFKNEQICFQPGIKSDSVMRFAEGTVIMKRIRVPEITDNSQAFIELVEQSNGDAYDRTGSVFMIAEDQSQSFLDGMKNGMKTLPAYENGDGQSYLGMVRTIGYSPILELMRFFTPFGVSHFNGRLALKDKTWQDSVTYRQDVSEFLKVMGGKEVYIGTYIGNYDKGGHKVSLELTIHPGGSNYAKDVDMLALFNTTNVMEMGGQGYPTLFGQEKGLEFEFVLDKDVKNAKLRYITTGHGGWGNGDEFVPKTNAVYLDDQSVFQFTPWRVDCGSYRLYNPVSGNFENGLSSSDLSRSNWCPGTITYPMFIDLGNLKAGKHRLRVQIPQGPKEGDSISFWNVSGALLFDKE
ncbi:PNGase F N-terminal domain-containing protein [Sphingobacterium yanglingense]|uniref:GLPGLI family protein n=1 Tax=Sphingobacterium yanglingense TaxID=1437280 RepID=A0A4R6WLR3_9SPHI|nr:PNGase F N-terminal domain-containing protein [Sphingobacterium yanglingense]TDQ79702.1 GLPGLI family protein [Sphingobacterium yanglingense]